MEQKDVKEICVFVILSIGLCSLISAPVWYLEGDLKRAAGLFFMLAMWTPGLSAITIYFFTKKQHHQKFKTFFQITLGKKWVTHYIFHIFLWPLIALVSPFVGSLFGVFELDITCKGFEKMILEISKSRGDTNPFADISLETIVALQIAGSFTGALVNIPFAIGEELGWRGYLLPKLQPLGFWKANLILGGIWGIWHTPLILLGHNYPDHPVQGIAFMVIFCLILGTLLNWSVWKSKSIWPAVFGHGAINGSAATIILFQASEHQFDPRWAGVTGITGWICPLLIILIMYIMNLFPKEELPTT